MNGGVDKGVVCYGPSNNTPRMVATCHANVRALFEIIGVFAGKKVCDSAFLTLITTLNKDTTGTGELKLQKIIYAIACCDDHMSTDWICFCKPRSNEHCNRLKERKYWIEPNLQAGQMIKLISERAQMPVPKAKHLLCMMLSNKNLKEFIIQGYNLYYCVKDNHGKGMVQFVNGKNGEDKQVWTGGFQFGSSATYYPA
jgi:hypothetical protein